MYWKRPADFVDNVAKVLIGTDNHKAGPAPDRPAAIARPPVGDPTYLSFRSDNQDAYVSTELEGLECLCRHGTIGWATRRDRCDVTDAGW